MQDAFGVERVEVYKSEGYGWTSREAQKKGYKESRRNTSPIRGPHKGQNFRNIAAGAGIGAGAGAALGAAITPGARGAGAALGGSSGASLGGYIGSEVNHIRENNASLKRNLASGNIRWNKSNEKVGWNGVLKPKKKS